MSAATPVTLVAPALQGLPGQARYVDELARHLPGPTHVLALRKPAWAQGAAARTLAAWASYPLRRPGPEDGVVHGTDTFCTVPGVDVVTVHDLIPLLVSREATARAHLRLFGRRLRAARIITLTRTWADRIVAALGVEPGRVHVVPQGCSVQAPPAGAPRPAAFADGRPNILCVGAYRPYKRVHELLAAAAALGARVVRVGPPGDGPYHRLCVATARRTGCDLVDVGHVPEDRLPAYYAAADLVVYVSQEEGFGFPPLEAMACGTTSLVSDIPVFRELHGDLVRYATGDLRADVGRALAEPVAAPRLRAHAERFSWDATAKATAAVHRLAAEERTGARAPAPVSRGSPGEPRLAKG